jgi:hypothetical protein
MRCCRPQRMCPTTWVLRGWRTAMFWNWRVERASWLYPLPARACRRRGSTQSSARPLPGSPLSACRGIFAFDVFNPNVRLLARPSGQRFPVFQVETEAFGKLTVEETTDYGPATQLGHGRWYISAPGTPDAWVLNLDLRNIFPQELPLLVAAGGVHLKSRMGGPIPSAFQFQQPFPSMPLSGNSLTVCRKPDRATAPCLEFETRWATG